MEIPFTDEAIAAVKAGATPTAIKAVEALAKNIASTASKAVSRQLGSIISGITTNFGPHLELTYDRCSRIKTLVSRDEPVDLLDQYVPLEFSCTGQHYDDIATLDEIRKRKRIVISGTGGGGKTIFTKFIWLSFFEKPDGQIPLFIELRRLNDIDASADSLLTLIYYTVVASHADVKREIFDRGVSSGLFVFILDGFDEVALDKKAGAQKQILALANNNPKCTVVVSGRPDESFDSWQAFSNFKVKPLTKAKVIQLIQKLSFDKTTKKKFIARVKADLYQKHVSFLSTPLLATLMLLTFQQFADIPEKIHLFYEQAFETLFARHDAMKETFKRDMHSKLPIDVFKRYFSYFCLVSYFDQKYEFTDEEIKSYIEKGMQIEGTSLEVESFISDLQQSICVIQRDGLKLVFTHRSFQEFFSAYCLSRLGERHFRKIVESIADRRSDTVLQMLYDINEERLETEYLLPAIDDFFMEFTKDAGDDFVYRFLKIGNDAAGLAIRYNRDPFELELAHFDNVSIRSVASALFERNTQTAARIKKVEAFRKKDEKAMAPLAEILRQRKTTLQAMLEISIDPDGSGHLVLGEPNDGQRNEIGIDWLGETGFADYTRERIDFLTTLRKTLADKAGRRDKTIDKIFRI